MTRAIEAKSFEAESFEARHAPAQDGDGPALLSRANESAAEPAANVGAPGLEGPLGPVVRSASLQLLFGLLLGVALPSLVIYALNPAFWAPGSGWNTVVGASVAIVFGFVLLRQMTRFPGLTAASYVIPCFTGAFGLLLFAFFFVRIDYARALFLASYGVSTVWFFVATVTAQLLLKPRYGFIPVGDLGSLKTIENAEFVELEGPRLPAQPTDGLVADLRADLPDEWETFISDCVLDGRQVFHVKHLAETLTGRVDIEHLSENSFGSLDPGTAFRKLKLAMDWTIAALLLPVFAILMLVVGLLIKLDSPGPVFFMQERIGYRGRVIRVFKFRTMTHRAAPAGDGKDASKTLDADPRITRVGKVLRQTRIDEIPQLLNILRAEMSWIGPRPEARPLSEWYEGELPFYRYRHVVRPGITGWAQINQGHVVEMNDVLGKLHYDFYYIKHFSPWLDAAIALRTVWVMIRGVGAR